MDSVLVAFRVLALVVPLLLAGWAAARLGSRRVDLFAAAFWGLAFTSVVSIVLGRTGSFGLTPVAGALLATALAAWAIGRVRTPAAPSAAPPPLAHRIVPAAAALLAISWSWPPFETFMAAADSTMYVDAGVHLAATGSYDVADHVARVLPPDLARALFMSVDLFDAGPYVRLPGGLLMETRDAATATPAFFPLVSTWSGILAAIGGPAWAPVIAPLGMGLATWALATFAIETLGLAITIPTVLVFLANFAAWWFGRFTMPEPMTIAFVWSGLAFLGRRAHFTAGVMLGLAGVARAETIVFTIAAVAWWAAWTAVPRRTLVALAAGVVLAGALSSLTLLASPNHQLSYLRNDLVLRSARIFVWVYPSLNDGRMLSALALLPLLPAYVIVAAAWRRHSVALSALRCALALGTVTVGALYVRLGGGTDPIRHLGWLASSLSPLGLVLALAGVALVWARGGTSARLGVILTALVFVVFVLNPRIGDYQPWAMRRYLPVVIPGLSLFAGTAIGALWSSRRRGAPFVAAALCAATVGLQVHPILPLRDAPYFSRSLSAARAIADAVPPSAVLVVDGSFAELQMQVPIWLVFGRETILATAGGPAWRALLPHLVGTGRAVYWLQHRYGPAPQVAGLAFRPLPDASDFTIDLPHSPADVPPSRVIRKVVPLQLYEVTRRG